MTNGNDKVKTFKLHIQGISPLLMNPMTADILDQLEGGAAARKPKDLTKTSYETAAEKLYKDEIDRIGIPALNLFSCLVEAGRQVKIDAKRGISNSESTLLPSFLAIKEFFLPFEGEPSWAVDRRRGVLEATGTAVCLVRPRFDAWDFYVTVDVDLQEISLEKVQLLFQKAGNSVGLCDFRPACRGPFGRFRVVEWAEKEESAAA